MKRFFVLFASFLALTGCSTMHRIDTTTLPADESVVLTIPNLIAVGKIDGVPGSNPLCTGPFCSKGIQITLTPGEHEVEVRYATAYQYAVDFVPVKHTYEKGQRYKLVYYTLGNKVHYLIENEATGL